MDHLATDEERRARWYSSCWPRYVSVTTSTDWQGLLRTGSDEEEDYAVVKSVPFQWLLDHKHQDQNLLQSILDQHGFVVVSGVLSETECRHALSLAWDYIEAASVAEQQWQQQQPSCRRPTSNTVVSETPVQRTLPSTHSSPYFPRSIEGGMLPYYGSGHSTLAWCVRSHPNVETVFGALHNHPETAESMSSTNHNLISSLDGIVLWREGKQHRTDAGWFHVDQNPTTKPNKECVQGLVNLLPVTPCTGGNVLVAKSHLHFPHHYTEAMKDSDAKCLDFYHSRLEEIGTDDWMEIDPNDDVILQPRRTLCCLLKPGDMLLWDSRVVHCSYPGTQDGTSDDATTAVKSVAAPPATAASSVGTGETEHHDPSKLLAAAHGLVRAAVAVSMMPRERASQLVLQQRRDAVRQCRTLTHWADKVAPLGEERPDQVALEAACVQSVKQWQKVSGTKVLLDYDDLSANEKRLVGG